MLENNLKKRIYKLHQKKFRREFGEFLIEGIKSIEEALRSDTHVRVVVMEGKRRDDEGMLRLAELAKKKDVNVEYCGRNDIDEIKTTHTFSGVIAIVEMPDYELQELQNSKPIVLLDRISDPGNLGTIIRTADWFGISNILLSEDSVELCNEKVVRSTMGSVFRVKIVGSLEIVEDVKRLKKMGYRIVCLTMDGKDFSKFKPSAKTVYIFGSESHGVSQKLIELSDESFIIMGNGLAESLNVAVAAGIVLSKI